MRNTANFFAVRASVFAVEGALIALAMLPSAYAQTTASDLTKPTNSVEVGGAYVNKDSAKFGEYNGLDQKGGYFLGGFDVKGGGTYDSDSALRFRITGRDLGLDTRNLGAEFGEQGKFRITFGFDEIVKNRSDSFQTPYGGAGTANQSLPANWATNFRNCTVSGRGGVVGAQVGNAGCGNYYVNQSTAGGNSTATPAGNAGALTPAEISDFYNYNLSTQRKKYDFGASYIFNSQWQVSASARHETKDGAQAIGQPIGSATASQVTLAQPISYTTNQYEMKLDWKGDRAYAQAAYYASIFQNGIQAVTYQDPYFSSFTPSITAAGLVNFPFPDAGRFSSAPNNQLHQIKLSGGYDFTKTMKLVGDYAYSRNTQDQGFMPYATGLWENVVRPANSLDGNVVQQAFNLRLTEKLFKTLKLGAAYKYDHRDDRTPGTNGWRFTEGDLQTPFTNGTIANPTLPVNTPGGLLANRPNAATIPLGIVTQPYDKKIEQANLDADYAFAMGQAVKGGYQWQKVEHHCSATKFDCANAPVMTEDTWRAEYRNNMLENVTGRISYLYGDRSAGTYTNSPYLGAGLAGDTLTRFMFTDRKRDKWRASVNWQATDTLDFTLGYDYNKDRYTLGKNPSGITALYPNGGQPIGLSDAKTDAINIDAGYRISDMVSLNAFYSRENLSSLLVANVNPAGATGFNNPAWSADMKDKVDTYGFGVKALQVVPKLDLGGDSSA
jgi:MtrB/PioB family decaheme-associated outer membrane protein